MFLAARVIQQVFVWASWAATAWWFHEGLHDSKRPKKMFGKKQDRLGSSKIWQLPVLHLRNLKLGLIRIREHRNHRQIRIRQFSFWSHNWFYKEGDSSETLEVVRTWRSQPLSQLQMLCEETKGNSSSPQDEARILHLDGDEDWVWPSHPKSECPIQREWEKQFYCWRTAINNYYEGREYVDWIEIRCSTSEGAVPGQFVWSLARLSCCNSFSSALLLSIAISAKKSDFVIVGNGRRSVVDAYAVVLHPENHGFTHHLILNLVLKECTFSTLNWLGIKLVIHSDYHVFTHHLISNLVFHKRLVIHSDCHFFSHRLLVLNLFSYLEFGFSK